METTPGAKIAADPAADGLHETERGVGRDGGVDGAAARFQNVERDLGCQRLASRSHAVGRDDFRAGGEQFTGESVAGDGKAPAAYFCKPRKATFLIRHFYNIFTVPLTLDITKWKILLLEMITQTLMT